MTKPPRTIDEYIAGYPEDVRKILRKIRATIRKAAPGVEEAIKYGVAAFVLDGTILIFFGGYKKHIGLYPAPRQADEFREELAAYKGGKGTVQFPLDRPIPYGLITRIVKYRVRENRSK